MDAALFALRSPLTRGIILEYEVGLGKTIEAGIDIAQNDELIFRIEKQLHQCHMIKPVFALWWRLV